MSGMMRPRLLFGGLACGTFLGLATGACALEPVRPEPHPAAKPCPRQGAGFIQIPGSTTCIRVGGRATAGMAVRAREEGTAVGPVAAGRLAVETRTDSDYGPVRTYVRIDAGRR